MTCLSSTICTPDQLVRRKSAIAAALATFLLVLVPVTGSGAVSPETPGSLVQQAEDHLLRGDAIAAQAMLREARDKGASRKAVAATMGRVLLALDKPVQARRWLESGEFSQATAVPGFRALAALELHEGHVDAAGEAYNRALAITPRDADLWTEIARYRYVGGEHLLAIEASDHALALDAENAAALQLRAELVRDREGMVPALEWFEKALDQSPENVALLGEYAATLGDAGEAVRMLAATRRMLELDPGNPQAFYLQSVMAARAGDYRLARKLLSKAKGELDNVPGVMLLEGILEIAARNYTLAIEALDPLVRRQPANRRARELLARAIFLSGEYKLLIDRFAKAAQREDASAYLQMLVARAYEQLDERGRAAALLDSVASVGARQIVPLPANSPIGQMLAARNASEAEALVGKWLAANPGNFDNFALAGDVQLAMGNARRAMDFYEEAAKIRMPQSLLSRRFQAMLMAGVMEQAVQLAETSLANNPSSLEARRIVAWLSAYSGDWARSRRVYENLVGTRRTRDLQLLSDLALVQIKAGAIDEGEATAQRAYRLYRSHPFAAQAWGLGLAARESSGSKASALLEKARKLMGDNALLAEARRKLADEKAS